MKDVRFQGALQKQAVLYPCFNTDTRCKQCGAHVCGQKYKINDLEKKSRAREQNIGMHCAMIRTETSKPSNGSKALARI